MRELSIDEIDSVSGGVGPMGALVGIGLGTIGGGSGYLINHIINNDGHQITFGGFTAAVVGGGVTGAITGWSAGLGAGIAAATGTLVTGAVSSYFDRHAGNDFRVPSNLDWSGGLSWNGGFGGIGLSLGGGFGGGDYSWSGWMKQIEGHLDFDTI